MTDLDIFVKEIKEHQKESETINKIIDMLIEFDVDTAERILTYVSSRIEVDWYHGE